MTSTGMEQLLFGTLQLARGANLETPDAPYELYALAEDASFGNPVPITTVIDSLLGDGQLVSIDRHSNREARFGIRVKGTTGLALSIAEAALIEQTERANTLTYVGPDGFTPATVFDVVTSWAEHVFDSDDEINQRRRYIITLSLYPHSRPATSTTVPALGSGVDPSDPPVEVTVSTCDSTTGWTGRIGTGIDPIATTGGFVYLRGTIPTDLWVQFDTGTVQNWTDTPYVVVDWSTSGSADPAYSLTTRISGPFLAETVITQISTGPSPLGAGIRRSVFDLGAWSGAARFVKFQLANELTSPAGARWTLRINNVLVTDGGAANDGTTRQLTRSLEIRGSARAMGVIDIRHENELGDVLVWSGPAACAPQLRRVRSSGAGEVGDITAVSGAYEDIGTTAFVADVPLATLPSGAYFVLARMSTTSSAGTYLVDLTAQTRIADTESTTAAVGPTLALNNVRVDLSPDPTRKIVRLGVLHLPSAEVAPGSVGVLRVSLTGEDVRLDDAWLYNITDGSLTWVVDAGKVLQLTSPTVTDPRRRVWTGPKADALYDAGSKTEIRGQHRFNPGEWAAHTVTTDVQDAAVTVTYDKRWHTFAGEDG